MVLLGTGSVPMKSRVLVGKSTCRVAGGIRRVGDRRVVAVVVIAVVGVVRGLE